MINSVAQLSKTPIVQPGTSDRMNKPWVDLLQGQSQQIASLARGVSAPYAISGLLVFSDNTAAAAGGLKVGQLYRTGSDPDLIAVVH